MVLQKPVCVSRTSAHSPAASALFALYVCSSGTLDAWMNREKKKKKGFGSLFTSISLCRFGGPGVRSPILTLASPNSARRATAGENPITEPSSASVMWFPSFSDTKGPHTKGGQRHEIDGERHSHASDWFGVLAGVRCRPVWSHAFDWKGFQWVRAPLSTSGRCSISHITETVWGFVGKHLDTRRPPPAVDEA